MAEILFQSRIDGANIFLGFSESLALKCYTTTDDVGQQYITLLHETGFGKENKTVKIEEYQIIFKPAW